MWCCVWYYACVPKYLRATYCSYARGCLARIAFWSWNGKRLGLSNLFCTSTARLMYTNVCVFTLVLSVSALPWAWPAWAPCFLRTLPFACYPKPFVDIHFLYIISCCPVQSLCRPNCFYVVAMAVGCPTNVLSFCVLLLPWAKPWWPPLVSIHFQYPLALLHSQMILHCFHIALGCACVSPLFYACSHR